jgi:hypothetical protein
MSDQEGNDSQRRDKLLLRLLQRPPQPRPTRKRDKEKPKATSPIYAGLKYTVIE